LTIVAGRPRRAITASNSRTTRWPPIEPSTTRAERRACAIVHDRQDRGEDVGDDVDGEAHRKTLFLFF
jgi:hypothetical protein